MGPDRKEGRKRGEQERDRGVASVGGNYVHRRGSGEWIDFKGTVHMPPVVRLFFLKQLKHLKDIGLQH